MRIVLDTNVLVAALIARGTCADLLEHCVRRHTIVSSDGLLEELIRVLTKKFGQSSRDAKAAASLFGGRFVLVEPRPLDRRASRDADDDAVLATALTGACQAIVTGDQDLLVLDPFQAIRILTPAGFWKWEAE